MKYNRWRVASVLVICVILLASCKTIDPSAGNLSTQIASTTQTMTPADSLTPAISGGSTQNTEQSALPTPSVSAGETTTSTEAPVAVSSENPLAPEKNPPGDIPDTQVFIKYGNAAGGYEVQVPEGWSRTESGANVSFIDKFDGVQIAISQSSEPFTLEGIKATQVSNLQKTGRAIQIKSITEKKTKGGSAILVAYESNSEPDAVTGKQVRLENECYYFFKDGKLASLTLWAPLGADNVDQWKYMSDSFGWN